MVQFTLGVPPGCIQKVFIQLLPLTEGSEPVAHRIIDEFSDSETNFTFVQWVLKQICLQRCMIKEPISIKNLFGRYSYEDQVMGVLVCQLGAIHQIYLRLFVSYQVLGIRKIDVYLIFYSLLKLLWHLVSHSMSSCSPAFVIGNAIRCFHSLPYSTWNLLHR